VKLKQYLWQVAAFLVVLIIFASPAYSRLSNQTHTGIQISTLSALNAGVFQGATTFDKLKAFGNFGLGTLEGLDGEMVLLDGKFYQIKTDGIAYSVADQATTPFAVVTFFQRPRSLHLKGQFTYQQLQQQIDQQLPTTNTPYAIRVQGAFPALKVRSVPKQSPPYRSLNEVVSQQQKIFEMQNVQGTLVGFRLPQYFKGLNVAGYHFHFMTRDRKTGGHLLEGTFLNPMVDVEIVQNWQITLPKNSAFEQAALE
jgi:acetolactate decarboxylase